MLTLTRRADEGIVIGDDVEVVVLSINRGRVRLGIRAPRSVTVHRSELVASVGTAIQEAVFRDAPMPISEPPADNVIQLPRGLMGMSAQKRYVLRAIDEGGALWVLVACDVPGLQILVAEAVDVMSDYPVERAHELAAQLHPELTDEEVTVAVIVKVPADGSGATVNLAAPLVIGLESRRGAQIIVDRPDLGVEHAIAIQQREGEAHP